MQNRALKVSLTVVAANSGCLFGSTRAYFACLSPSSPAHFFRFFQAAAAARIVGKVSVLVAAERGNLPLIGDHIIADPKCVFLRNDGYTTPTIKLVTF